MTFLAHEISFIIVKYLKSGITWLLITLNWSANIISVTIPMHVTGLTDFGPWFTRLYTGATIIYWFHLSSTPYLDDWAIRSQYCSVFHEIIVLSQVLTFLLWHHNISILQLQINYLKHNIWVSWHMKYCL